MSQIMQEISRVIDSIVLKKPIYKIKLENGYWGQNIRFKCTSANTTNCDSFISEEVAQHVVYTVDFNSGTVKANLGDNLLCNVKDEMKESLIRFILHHSGSKNPKLTTLYKWYYKLNGRHSTVMGKLNKDEKVTLEDLLFNVWKYTETACGTTASSNNGIKILEFIKAKYEIKLKEMI